jgi:hypothetical protein
VARSADRDPGAGVSLSSAVAKTVLSSGSHGLSLVPRGPTTTEVTSHVTETAGGPKRIEGGQPEVDSEEAALTTHPLARATEWRYRAATQCGGSTDGTRHIP